MTIKRQLSAFYSVLYFVIVGIIVLTSSVFTYNALNDQAVSGMGAVVDDTKNLIEMDYHNIIKNYLKGIAEKDKDIVSFFHEEFVQGRMSEDQAKRLAAGALLSQKIGKTGYVYCVDSSGTIRVHPKKELIGIDLSTYDFIQTQKRDKGGYIQYHWANPGEQVKRPKALYMSYFAPWDWIISVSSYRSEFTDLVNIGDFAKGLLDIKLGKTGYLYVMDYNGNLLVHPSLQGQNIAENKDERGFYYIKAILAKKDGMLSYAWKNPGENRQREKVVYFRSVDDLGIIIVGGTYRDELVAANAKIVLVSLLLFVVGFGIIILVSVRIAGLFSRPIKSTMELIRSVGQGDLTAVLEAKLSGRKDELGQMAKAAEDMQRKLGELTMAVRASAAAVQGGSNEIGGAIDEQAATTAQMSASVAEITSTMEELSASSTQIAEHSKSVVDIANQTWENSKNGSQSMKELQDKIEGIRSDNEVSLREIVELGRKSKEISKVMAIINTGGRPDQAHSLQRRARGLERGRVGQALRRRRGRDSPPGRQRHGIDGRDREQDQRDTGLDQPPGHHVGKAGLRDRGGHGGGRRDHRCPGRARGRGQPHHGRRPADIPVDPAAEDGEQSSSRRVARNSEREPAHRRLDQQDCRNRPRHDDHVEEALRGRRPIQAGQGRMSVRVLIADDSDFARSVIRAALESDGGIVVAGEARNGREAVELSALARAGSRHHGPQDARDERT